MSGAVWCRDEAMMKNLFSPGHTALSPRERSLLLAFVTLSGAFFFFTMSTVFIP